MVVNHRCMEADEAGQWEGIAGHADGKSVSYVTRVMPEALEKTKTKKLKLKLVQPGVTKTLRVTCGVFVRNGLASAPVRTPAGRRNCGAVQRWQHAPRSCAHNAHTGTPHPLVCIIMYLLAALLVATYINVAR